MLTRTFVAVWLLIVSRYRSREVSKNKMEMARITLQVQPDFEEKKWDQVAQDMNAFLFEEGKWNTRNFFFDELLVFGVF